MKDQKIPALLLLCNTGFCGITHGFIYLTYLCPSDFIDAAAVNDSLPERHRYRSRSLGAQPPEQNTNCPLYLIQNAVIPQASTNQRLAGLVWASDLEVPKFLKIRKGQDGEWNLIFRFPSPL